MTLKQKTPMQRKVPMKVSKPAPGPRKVSCKICKVKFLPSAPWIKHCSEDCGAELGLMLVAKQKAKVLRQERAETKAKLAQYETIPQLKARLQEVFNKFIRLRDDAYPCICCGKWPQGVAALSGGQWDACHWKGRGAHDHLRFSEDNVHKGLKDCNKYGHTDYRGGLIKRIGLERVLALESDSAIVKWDRDWLRERIAHYQRRVRELRRDLT